MGAIEMRGLTTDQQVAALEGWSKNRRIQSPDPYLDTYDELQRGVQALLPLDRTRLVLVANAAFGWMPTRLDMDVEHLDEALKLVTQAIQPGGGLSEQDLAGLARTFRTVKGQSIVAVSKILHFLSPERYPMFDRNTCDRWGLKPRIASDYLYWIQQCRKISADENGGRICDDFRKGLAEVGYRYPMSNLRIIDLISFLDALDT